VIVTFNLVIVVEVCYVNVLLSLCWDSARGVGCSINGSLYRLKCLVSSERAYVPQW
jgi:hypothetical protein